MGVIHPDITKAQTLPSEYYTNEQNYFGCTAKVFLYLEFHWPRIYARSE
jgi:hypothetical protein